MSRRALIRAGWTLPAILAASSGSRTSCVDRFVGRLATLHDIAAVVEHYRGDTDWGRLLQLSRDRGADRFIYHPFWLAHRVARADIPTSILQALI